MFVVVVDDSFYLQVDSILHAATVPRLVDLNPALEPQPLASEGIKNESVKMKDISARHTGNITDKSRNVRVPSVTQSSQRTDASNTSSYSYELQALEDKQPPVSPSVSSRFRYGSFTMKLQISFLMCSYSIDQCRPGGRLRLAGYLVSTSPSLRAKLQRTVMKF